MHNPKWANYIRMNRKSQDLTLRQLAEMANIDASYLTLIERDGYVPRRDKVLAISKALGLDSDRSLLEAGYAPERIAISAILGKNPLDIAEDSMIPELGDCLRELVALSTIQQRKVADFLSSIISTLQFRERTQSQTVRESREDYHRHR